MIAFFNGKFLPVEEISISPFDRGFLFGDGVYETLRTYNKKLFFPEKHFTRLNYSLRQLDINFSKIEEIPDIIYKCANMNNLDSQFAAYVQITRGISFPRVHHYTNKMQPNIFIYTFRLKDNSAAISNGVSVNLQQDIRWNRCDIKTISLLPNILANQTAILKGNYEAVLFRNNFITEGSHTSFFGVKDKVVYTSPLSNLVLNGTTRGIIIEICKANNIYFSEEYILTDELFNYEEFFITGTLTEVTTVVKIDEKIIGDGKPGEVTLLIQKCFSELTKNY